MKTETVVTIAVLGAAGVAIYFILKRQSAAAPRAVVTPIQQQQPAPAQSSSGGNFWDQLGSAAGHALVSAGQDLFGQGNNALRF